MNINLTPSKADELQHCPFAFQQKYLNQTVKVPAFQSSPAAMLGNHVHAVLKLFYQRGAHTRLGSDDLLTLSSQKWDGAGFADSDEELAYHQQARTMLADFYTDTYAETAPVARANEKFYQLEKPLSLGRHKVWLSGRFDRLDVLADGTVEVIDYKTTTSNTGLPDEQELAESLANLVYCRLAMALYPDAKAVTVSYYYLRSRRKVSARFTPERVTSSRQHLQELLDELETGVAAPLENLGCTWCIVRKHNKCPLFRAAASDDASLVVNF